MNSQETSAAHLVTRMIVDPFRSRRHFGSLRKSLQTVPLRLAVTRTGSRWLRPRDVDLSLAHPPVSLVLRRGTYDVFAALEIFVAGEYRLADQWNLRADATIVDLGANVGFASLYFSMRWPLARFLAVEPDADNLRILRANCARLIEAGRIQIVEGFVAAQDGHASIDRSRGTLGYRIGPDAGGHTIPRWSLRSLLTAWPRLDLLKCDIEGAEAEVFRDCRDWIARVDHLIVETHMPYTAAQLYADLTANGWRFRVLGDKRKGSRANRETSTCFLERQPPALLPVRAAI